ncbi:lipo-like protein [Vibrio sp. 10N.286.49.B3]|uniref:YbaY family lipoprotein n=1 Tax=Vibrio sp. 10N.286.49.B3 TaxID=1880855 RepID=UPI000C82A1D2|nr:YbaY family lipoprotein [Vibrio sp. 10N.286.49.B3]PMH45038.1 lipo-like protein [Vibrio sp. 10N.286.49.B3]
MKRILLAMVSITLSFFMLGCQSTDESGAVIKSITGTVAYRERITLPGDAIVKVVLEDVSLADAKATVLASQTFMPKGQQVPLSFQLDYDVNKVDARHRYNVRARIEIDGKLRFISDRSFPVITDSKSTHDINLLLVGVR